MAKDGASGRSIARQLRLDQQTVQNYLSGKRVAPGTEPKELLLPLLKKVRKEPWTVNSIADYLNIGPSKVSQALEQLRAEGHNVAIRGEEAELGRTIEPSPPTRIDVSKFKGKAIRFGLTSDNHLGSKYARMDVLNALFDTWADQGIDTVYQCGNMIDGEASFNKFDLLVRGMQGQVDYFVENWPQRKGITTKYVTGDDHEGWYVQREGVNIGQYIELCAQKAGRKDLDYLGHIEHDVIYNSPKGHATMRVIHAGGGSAYATSYAPQKIVECVPLHSEILTKTGWKKHNQVAVGEVVLGYNVEKDKCEWTKVTALHEGEEKVFRHHNDQFDVTCTINHKWAIEWEQRAGPNPNSRVPESYSKKERHLWPIGECKDRSRIIQAAMAPSGPGLSLFEHEDWLHRNSTATLYVLAMTSGERRAYIEGLLQGEGTIAGESRTIVFGQRPGPVNDAFRLACLMEGIATTDRPTPPGSFKPEQEPARRVTLLKKRMRNESSLETEDLGVQKVWCPTTVLGTWVMRQGDLMTITGNSYQGGEKPNILLIGHYHKAEYGYPREVHVVQAGCTEDQTPFMRKLKIQAHVGGWTIGFDLDDNGVVHGFAPQFHPFYDRSFYSKWKYLY